MMTTVNFEFLMAYWEKEGRKKKKKKRRKMNQNTEEGEGEGMSCIWSSHFAFLRRKKKKKGGEEKGGKGRPRLGPISLPCA